MKELGFDGTPIMTYLIDYKNVDGQESVTQ